jgi:EAL domain-containing protein (putative c-di-GMP-specific phosphodiesterase class I)
MDVIAEKVEAIEQLTQLKKQGCEYAQGYYLSPPFDTKNAEKFIIDNPK